MIHSITRLFQLGYYQKIIKTDINEANQNMAGEQSFFKNVVRTEI